VRKNFSSIARAEGFYPDDLAQTLSSSRSCRN
jgi:hypothetical protein